MLADGGYRGISELVTPVFVAAKSCVIGRGGVIAGGGRLVAPRSAARQLAGARARTIA